MLKVYSQVSPTVRIIPLGDNQCITYNPHENYLFDNSPVIKTCKGNTVTYEAVGQNLTSYTWTVTGGSSQLSQNNQQCTVTWGNDDHGSIEVTCTTSSEETCADRLNVYIEDKPTCRSISTPAYYINPNNPSDKIIHVCLGDSLIFTDNSVSPSSPIVSYYWASPWGTSANRTYSFSAQSIGSDFELVHRIYNECGCYDEETVSIIVDEACPLELSCYGTVCAHSSADYFVNSPTCSSYHWDVDGGTIIDGQNTQHIKVLWGAPETGYGTISLDATPCQCSCKAIKSVRIPVISENVPIKGPDIICNNSIESFSLPLWGGTGYHWTVSPENNASIIQADSTNEILLRTSQTGTYTITATYKCDFIHCGSYTATKTITVKDNLEITSPQTDIVCKGEDATFTTNSTTASSWSIFKNNIPVHQPSSPSVELIYAFSDEGFYTIKATNTDFCNTAEMTIEVAPIPPQPTNINGPHEVCPNSSEYYSATVTSPNYFIEWEWNNGNTTATCSGERVMITFGNTVSNINIYQVDKRSGCRSQAVVWNITAFQFDPWPYNTPINVCEGQSFELNSLPLHPDVPVLYKWAILPSQALSINGDPLVPNVSVTANYCTPTVSTAYMTLRQEACNTFQTNVVTVNLGVIDPPAIASPGYCSNVASHLNLLYDEDIVNADLQQSYWVVNHGIGVVHGIPGTVTFPSSGTYNVTLYYVSRFGCTATCSTAVTVYDFPALSLTENAGQLCISGGTVPPLSCTWSNGMTNTQCIPLPNEDVSCTVQSANGCSTTLYHRAPLPPCTTMVGFVQVTPICYNIVEVSIDPNIQLPATLSFFCGGSERGQPVQLRSHTQRVLIPQPCVNELRLSWDDHFCDSYTMQPLSNGDWLSFRIEGDCLGNIVISDNSSYSSSPLPAREVTVSGGATPIVQSFPTNGTALSIPAFGTGNTIFQFQIRITLDNDPNCYIDFSKSFCSLPHVDNLPTIKICQDFPAIFSDNNTASGCIISYKWNFRDGSYNFGNNIYHTYGTPATYTYTLTVTDNRGCTAEGSGMVYVATNTIHDNRDINRDIPYATCYGDPQKVIYSVDNYDFGAGHSFLWTPTIPPMTFSQDNKSASFDVTEGGDYRVMETDPATGCKGEKAKNITYPNKIPAEIICNGSYCQDEEVLALSNCGSQYQYSWLLKGASGDNLGGSTEANYRFTVPSDVYSPLSLTLEVSRDGCSISASRLVTINPLPNTPSISYNGNACITEGSVYLKAPPLYPYTLWSNGSQGSYATYYTDNPATAYYIDANGCRSSFGKINIPRAPNFDGLLTGCYPTCSQMPGGHTAVYTLGIASGAPWTWLREGNTVQYGTVPALPTPIQLHMSNVGNYRLEVNDYGQGCSALSPALKLYPVNCNLFGVPDGRRIHCSITKLDCIAEDCMVKYSGSLFLENMTMASVIISAINSSPLLSATWSPSLPLTISPGGSMYLSFSFFYDFSIPPAVIFTLYDNSGAVAGTFTIDLSNSIDCLDPGDCNFELDFTQTVNTTYTHALGAIYYNITCTCSTPGVTIMSVWCDGVGEMVSNTGGNPYSGIFMISHGRLTQMALNNEDFCFLILCCEEGKSPCLRRECISAEKLFQKYTDLFPHGKSPSANNITDNPAGARYTLQPNPTTGMVYVTDVATGAIANDIKEVTVMSLLGTIVFRHSGGAGFDVSTLPQGSYLVKIVSHGGIMEHLRLVKTL